MNRLRLLAAVLLAAPGWADPPRLTVELRDADLFGALEQASAVLGEFEYVAVAPDNRRMDATLTGTADEILEQIGERYGAPLVGWGPVHLLLPDDGQPVFQAVAAWLARHPPRGAAVPTDALSDAHSLGRHFSARSDAARAALLARARQLYANVAWPPPADGVSCVLLLEPDAEIVDAWLDELESSTWPGVCLAVRILESSPPPPASARLTLSPNGELRVDFGGRTMTSVLAVIPDDGDAGFGLWRPSGARRGRTAPPVLNTRLSPAGVMPATGWVRWAGEQATIAVDLPGEPPPADIAMRLADRPLWSVLHALSVVTGRRWWPHDDSLRYRLDVDQTLAGAIFAGLSPELRVAALLAEADAGGTAGVIWVRLTPDQRRALEAGAELTGGAIGHAAREAIRLAWVGTCARELGAELDAVRRRLPTAGARSCLRLLDGELSMALYQGAGRLTAFRLAGESTSPPRPGYRYANLSRSPIRASTVGSYGGRNHSPQRTAER